MLNKRIIEMLKTTECENTDGVMQVFGNGRRYLLDDETADRLLDMNSERGKVCIDCTLKRPKRSKD